MSKYGLESTSNSCVEPIKDKKKRLKALKLQLEDFMEVTEDMEINWNHRNEMVGTLYAHITRIKKEINHRKKNKK